MQFKQSSSDFPQMIKLGDKMPSFGFNRFKQELQFVPVDDEGFTLRGDKQRLLYNGQRRSHRFTILDDTSFEYDCILNKEPDCNIIRLRIDGAENFDFFRQPDFVKNPFLKGSYAVYKKQTLLGEGTGKLCHIHRPEIIDARGRRCWGTLSVVGNELQITVPEQWLSEAAYPVVVDPVIGTNTVGSFDTYLFQTYIDKSGNEVQDYRELFVLDMMLLNKVYIPENIGEIGTFYVYKKGYIYTYSTTYNTYPCIYSDVNNKPNTKISVNEQEITDLYSNRNTPGWLQAGISKNCPINEGDYIWFGVRGYNLITRFDYGGILEYIYVAYALNNGILLPDILGDNNNQTHFYQTGECHRNMIVSMYLTYEASLGINYKKTLFQNLNLNDNKNIKIEYNRKCNETPGVITTISKAQEFFRNCVTTASNSMSLNGTRFRDIICNVIDTIATNTRLFIKIEYNRKCTQTMKILTEISRAQTFFRHCVINAGVNMSINCTKIFDYICSITDGIATNTSLYIKTEYKRKCTQAMNAITTLSKAQTFFRTCILSAGNTMSLNGNKIIAKISYLADKIATETKLYIKVEYKRKCTQAIKLKTFISKTQSFFRRCRFTAGSNMWLNGDGKNKKTSSLIDKIKANTRLIVSKGISTKINDRIRAEGIVKRKLFLFLRIMTNSIVRSLINKRFLSAKIEITLKSRIGETNFNEQ
jgi:hypothetical protein